jgi:hypothetical protein
MGALPPKMVSTVARITRRARGTTRNTTHSRHPRIDVPPIVSVRRYGSGVGLSRAHLSRIVVGGPGLMGGLGSRVRGRFPCPRQRPRARSGVLLPVDHLDADHFPAGRDEREGITLSRPVVVCFDVDRSGLVAADDDPDLHCIILRRWRGPAIPSVTPNRRAGGGVAGLIPFWPQV